MPPRWWSAWVASARKQVRWRYTAAARSVLSHRGFAAKNLVLSGFRLVAVHDDDATQQADLAAQARAAAARRARGCS